MKAKESISKGNEKALRAGVGTAVITPPVGIEMGVWVLRRGMSQGVHDDMHARALVLEDGTTTAAIVSLDVIAVSTQMTEQIRELVADQTDIPKSNILLNCSHTHTSPFTAIVTTAPNDLSPGHRAYLKAFPHYVAGAIIEAWHRREEAAIGASSVEVPGITVNRRDPALPADPELAVIRVDDPEGRPLACLVNYACHGTAVGPHYLDWTAGFAGYVARTIEKTVRGCTGMFLQGAEGDIHPWDWYFGNPTPRFGDTFAGAERLGKAIAGPALGRLSQIETNPGAEIRVATANVALPPRPLSWTAEEAAAYVADLLATTPEYEQATIPESYPGCMTFRDFPETYRLLAAQNQARFAQDYPAQIDAELTVLRINDIVLAANPGELFNELGMQIKQRSPYPHTFVLSCTNASIAYLPVREAAEGVLALPLEEFVDPVKHHKDYGATFTTEVGPNAGDIVVAETLKLIEAI